MWTDGFAAIADRLAERFDLAVVIGQKPGFCPLKNSQFSALESRGMFAECLLSEFSWGGFSSLHWEPLRWHKTGPWAAQRRRHVP